LPCDDGDLVKKFPFSLIPRAYAGHLPQAPNRVVAGSRWLVVDQGAPTPVYEAEMMEPPLRDWCGVRFGFYSALPGTDAIEEGMGEGMSFWAIIENGDEGPQEISGSIGFDIERVLSEPLLTRELLEQGPVSVHLTIELDKLVELITENDSFESVEIAQSLVDGASVLVDVLED
jgi:hypothetical protein